MSKLFPDAASALEGVIKDDMLIAAGGFGLCGIPERLLNAIRDSGVTGLTFASNNAGIDNEGIGKLLRTRQVKKMISSYVGENAEFMRQYLSGELELEFNPQGTLAERIRAAGAGLGGFLTPTAYGTLLAEGKETRVIDGKGYVLEAPLPADFALLRADRGDPWGNLSFHATARNFNPVMAMASRHAVAEVRELSRAPLDPERVVTPGIFVQSVVEYGVRP